MPVGVAWRTVFFILGGVTVVWGAYMLPIFWRQVPVQHVATQVIRGDIFKPEILVALMPKVEAAEAGEPCSSTALRSAAIIRTREIEQALIDGEDFAMRLGALRDSILRSLACTPADPLLWLVYYWAESNRTGFQIDYIRYLGLSYELGPNEGWVALRRSPFALSIFNQLPPSFADKVAREFAGLLSSGLYPQAMSILTGAGWPQRQLLLLALKNVEERHRRVFARALYKAGYDVEVPGIGRPDARPWD